MSPYYRADPITQTCDHNCIPCKKWFRTGWVCVRCHEWSREPLPRLCPDCKLGPDRGVDGHCFWCHESYEAQKRDEALYAAGWDDALATTKENL